MSPAMADAIEDWTAFPGGRCRAIKPVGAGRTGFSSVDPVAAGIAFTNQLSQAALNRNTSLISGSGVALGDVDGDGWCDLYLCNLEGDNALFRNLGNWRFADITAAAGVACSGQLSRGAVLADVEGDGDLDLLVTATGGGVRLFINDGLGRFAEATTEAGLTSRAGSLSLALADVEGDGDLDLYVANFAIGSVLRDGGSITTKLVNGRSVIIGRLANRVKLVDGKLVEFGEPDALFLNDGQGRFALARWEEHFADEYGAAQSVPWDWGLAVQMRDFSGDGAPDIYVCNDFHTPDRVWINDGHGRFRGPPAMALRKSSYAAIGVDFADVNRDGHLDFLVVEMLSRDPAERLRQMTPDEPRPPQPGLGAACPQVGRNTLFLGRGDGTFAEVAWYAGLAASDWSWSPVFVDVDLDGFEDLLITTGPMHDLLDLDSLPGGPSRDARAAGLSLEKFPRVATPNRAFRNLGDLRFEEIGRTWGFASTNVSNGMALADLDNDGDLDVVVNCLRAAPLLLRNDSPAPRVAVRLKGRAPNTQGIGARLRVLGGAVPEQTQEVVAGGRYVSSDAPLRVFAAGRATSPLTIEVRWRSGRRTTLSGAKANHLYEIEEPLEAPAATSPESTPLPWFEDVSRWLGHVHVEPPFDDFARQPLLPHKLSQRGPGVAWQDFDADGRPELVIGCSRGGLPGIFRWNGQRFTQLTVNGLLPLPDDAPAVCGLAFGGQPCLLLGLTRYETTLTDLPAGWLLAAGTAPDSVEVVGTLPTSGPGSVSVMTAGDVNGDGDWDVFTAGGVALGQYPAAAPGTIWVNHNGRLKPDELASRPFAEVSLVSGAVFADLTSDGLPELALAIEWGPLRIFRNESSQFTEVSQTFGTAERLGLWQCVAAGDFDGDGRLDLIAGNWGENSERQASPERPWLAYCGDFSGDGVTVIVEARADPDTGRLLPLRTKEELGAAWPALGERFATHRAFSEAGVEGILGNHFKTARALRANTLASVVLLNRGGHFEAQPLPPEAQFAPAMGACVSDFDGDGHLDAFLAQNLFAFPSEARRMDAGRGLLLRGRGDGTFDAIPGQKSGIMIYGEQRGCAAADFDGDGRPDLVVTQNGAETKLYHNRGGSARDYAVPPEAREVRAHGDGRLEVAAP
jgi:hypothetical protein